MSSHKPLKELDELYYLTLAFKTGSCGKSFFSGYTSSKYSAIAILSINIVPSGRCKAGTAF